MQEVLAMLIARTPRSVAAICGLAASLVVAFPTTGQAQLRSGGDRDRSRQDEAAPGTSLSGPPRLFTNGPPPLFSSSPPRLFSGGAPRLFHTGEPNLLSSAPRPWLYRQRRRCAGPTVIVVSPTYYPMFPIGPYGYGGGPPPIAGPQVVYNVYPAYTGQAPPPQTYVIQTERARSDAARSPAVASGDDYYLYRAPGARTTDRALAAAVADIEAAFRTRDTARLAKHVAPGGTLSLRTRDGQTQALSGEDYLAATREALASLETTRFALDRTEKTGEATARASGRHELRAEDGATRVYRVEFGLVRDGDTWFISEVSATPER
jgi:hypothetical protein